MGTGTGRGRGTGVRAGAVLLACVSGCLPGSFDALSDAAPVETIEPRFPLDPNAEIAIALTVPASDEGRGRVLFGDNLGSLGWLRVDEDSGVVLRFALFAELAEIGATSEPVLTGLAVVPGTGAAEGLVRVAATETSGDRVVRFRVPDFSRSEPLEHDMRVYAWGDASWMDAPPMLMGPLAAVQLDDGLPEGLSGSSEGLLIWDALGTKASDYEAARAVLEANDPAALEADPSQGYGLTRCMGLLPTAIAGGRVLPGNEPAALALSGSTLTFIAVAEPAQTSLIGAPIYDCARATWELPGEAVSLAVVDLGLDDDDDLLVGAPASGRVWVYENGGDGLPDMPTMTLEGQGDEEDFGASLTSVELGGDAPEVIVVGAPGTSVRGKVGVGRVLVYDAADGSLLRTIEDLEPQTNSHHGLGVHGVDLPGREELVISGARELRIHWTIMADDPGPVGSL